MKHSKQNLTGTRKMKATHKGECQLCARQQKLPHGILSKHGYTVDFGFFSGTCKGSDNFPFEKSSELLESEILRAEQHVASENIRIAEYKAVDTTGMNKAMKNVRLQSFGRSTLYVEVTFREDVENFMVYADYKIFNQEHTTSVTKTAYYPHTIQGHVDSCRVDEARIWERNVKSLEIWIREAKERAAKWESKELQSI